MYDHICDASGTYRALVEVEDLLPAQHALDQPSDEGQLGRPMLIVGVRTREPVLWLQVSDAVLLVVAAKPMLRYLEVLLLQVVHSLRHSCRSPRLQSLLTEQESSDFIWYFEGVTACSSPCILAVIVAVDLAPLPQCVQSDAYPGADLLDAHLWDPSTIFPVSHCNGHAYEPLRMLPRLVLLDARPPWSFALRILDSHLSLHVVVDVGLEPHPLLGNDLLVLNDIMAPPPAITISFLHVKALSLIVFIHQLSAHLKENCAKTK
jgi:hypothetical protein